MPINSEIRHESLPGTESVKDKKIRPEQQKSYTILQQ